MQCLEKKKGFDSKERSIDLVFLFNFLIFILWRCVKRHGMIIALYSVSPYSTTPIYRSPLFIGGDSIINFFIIFFFVNLGMIPPPSHAFFIHINAYFGFDKKKEKKKTGSLLLSVEIHIMKEV